MTYTTAQFPRIMLQLGTCNFQFVSCIRHKNLNPHSANFQFPDGFKVKLLIPHGGIKKKLFQQTTYIKSNFDITTNKQSHCQYQKSLKFKIKTD